MNLPRPMLYVVIALNFVLCALTIAGVIPLLAQFWAISLLLAFMVGGLVVAEQFSERARRDAVAHHESFLRWGHHALEHDLVAERDDLEEALTFTAHSLTLLDSLEPRHAKLRRRWRARRERVS